MIVLQTMTQLFHGRLLVKTEFGKNPLCIFGINPSKADEYQYDLTMRKIEKFSVINNFNGYIMFNICSIRCTDPGKLPLRYSKEFFVERKYLSDSGQFWREGCLCQNLNKYERLQVLIHPMWWSRDGLSRDEIMDSFLGGEYDDYTPSIKLAKEKHEKHANKISKD